jgi:2,6-dihydroxypseudooxynicotine hydrolase
MGVTRPDARLEDVLRIHSGRLVGDGVPVPDVQEAETSLASWDEWFEFWARKAQRYETLADEALAQGRRRSAGLLYWYGSLAYQYAQFLWFHDLPVREAGQRQKQRLYDRAASLLSPPAERFAVELDGLSIPGFLRLPAGAGPHPAVVLLGGLESTKEESYLFENLCLERGLATCTFDGPGQGELFFQARLRPDFERFTSAVVDYLTTRPEIDAARLGVLGRSLGGYYAVRSAAVDRRFSACVAWGAMFDLSHYDRLHSSAQQGFAYVAGFDTPAEAAAYLRQAIDLSDVAEQLRCPLYVLHGAQDDLMPMPQLEKLRQMTKSVPEAVWDVPPDGNHCCHNLYHVVRPRMADWLAQQLGGNP